MASEQNIVKLGNLQKWMTDNNSNKPRWAQMFFVLHGTTAKNAARLDWYDSREQYQQNPGQRKALFLEEIKKCEKIDCTEETKKTYGSSAKYLLTIHTYRANTTSYVLNCSSEEVMKEWLDSLTGLLSHVRTISRATRIAVDEKPLDPNDIYSPNLSNIASSYTVVVDDTAAAIRCNLCGEYRLLLSQQHITLAELESASPVITWPYRNIRRFGYSDNSLTIEGGSKCGSGEGLFIFRTDEGRDLKEAITVRIKCCANQATQPPEDEYSYISFSGRSSACSSDTPKEKPSTKSAPQVAPTKASQPKPALYTSVNPSQQGKLPARPNDQLKPAVQQKPAMQQKPAPQQKMSEVLSQLPRDSAPVKEDDVYGYSHLDIKGDMPKPTQPGDEENPYGEQLIQKISNVK